MFIPVYSAVRPEDRDTFPLANTILIGLTAIVSCVNLATGGALNEALALSLADWNPLQLLSHGLLHASPAHLIGTLLCLFAFGNPVNRKLGNPGYLLLCGVGCVVGGVATVMTYSPPSLFSPGAQSMGASGSVYAVMAAYLWLCPRRDMWVVFPLVSVFFLGGLALATGSLFVGVTPGAALGILLVVTFGGYGVCTLLELWVEPKRRSLGQILLRLVGLRVFKMSGAFLVLLSVVCGLVGLIIYVAGRGSLLWVIANSVPHAANAGGFVAGLAATWLAINMGQAAPDAPAARVRTAPRRRGLPRSSTAARRRRRKRQFTFSEWERNRVTAQGAPSR